MLKPMRLLHLAYILALGAVTGLGSAWSMVGERLPFQRMRAGVWEAYPRLGAPDSDPYARAAMTQRTHLPLGLGEGLAFSAREDESGEALNSRCAYTLAGFVPPSRGWTLSLARLDGPLVAAPGDRIGFSDAELTRTEDGAFTLHLSRSATAGDWLPLPDIGAFRIVLRLYDTPVSGTASELRAGDLPGLKRGACS